MKLRQRFERFCYRNRDKGIPNLMLYISIGTAIVFLMSLFDKSSTLYYALCFNRTAILNGQIWRLFTYIFTYGSQSDKLILVFISLVCYYSLGRAMESLWGTLRFNLFYLTGVLLMDIYALIFNTFADVYYLNLSLLLGFATLYPDARFLFLFIIPVKAWIFGLLDLFLTLYDVYRFAQLGLGVFFSIFPLVAIGNYFLFFGKDVLNLIPKSWRSSPCIKKSTSTPPSAIFLHTQKEKPNYTHRCTVCGRTDVSNPELEFRYCSRCNGYFCYCNDHIANHTHVE